MNAVGAGCGVSCFVNGMFYFLCRYGRYDGVIQWLWFVRYAQGIKYVWVVLDLCGDCIVVWFIVIWMVWDGVYSG